MAKVDLSAGRYLLPPIHPEGLRFIVLAVLITALLTLLWTPLIVPGTVVSIWTALFFRDPERVPPADAAALTAPADGIVCMVQQCPLPEELEEPAADPVWRVSIFMSVFNVHVNRMPAAATILKRRYVKGRFFNASLDKASSDNERMLYLAQTDGGSRVAFVQIAGLVARRIVAFAQEGSRLGRAERFGLIRFGSRVDLYLPRGVRPLVKVGQTMVAGESVIALDPDGAAGRKDGLQ
jgi:phosphatidylserine decarboxylase